MDIRHPMTELDQNMLGWAEQAGVPTQILLTKADKLTRAKIISAVKDVESIVSELDGFAVAFSSQRNKVLATYKSARMTQFWVR